MKDVVAPAAPVQFDMPISEMIWDAKYRLKEAATKGPAAEGRNLAVQDLTVEDTWRRIARALAQPEKDADLWEERFYDALSGFRFLPAGRITAGAGTDRNVTLFNCYVMGTIPDSMAGIFDMLKEAALTMQQGGGIGYDFSTIRPQGAPVIGVGSDASGPLSFMDVWDAMCRTIMSAGARRGAMMATMRCDHPDIERFVDAKADAARLRNFNMSVLITDPFMDAVKADADWDLVFNGKVWGTIKAKDLWNRITTNTYNHAEPGVIFIDRINAANNLGYCETIAATNPCGEQPLPPYGACLLGSINMARLVKNAYESNAEICLDELNDLVRLAVRMMDNVVDISNFPLDQQRAEAQVKRRIGLGVTGLADALLMLGLRYGSEDAAAQTEAWMKAIARASYLASVDLAKEKGAFPLFESKAYLSSGFMKGMDDDVRGEIAEHGIRNALLTSIAPTGTISLYAGNVSSGIEPVFAFSYKRKVLQPDGSKIEEEVVDYAVKLWRDKFGDAPLPAHFVSAQTLTPQEHVRMQAAAQRWIDSSISKTINCPEDISLEDFQDVYMQAWEQGCKGCTTYRPNDVTGSVLTATEEKKVEAPVQTEALPAVIAPTGLMSRDPVLEGKTYKIKWPSAAHAYYLTVNDIVLENGQRAPFEVFINTQNTHDTDMLSALTRMISAIFRRGGDIGFVAEELRQIVNPQGGSWVDGQYVPSLVAMIGLRLFQHMEAIGAVAPSNAVPVAVSPAPEAAAAAPALRGPACPSCGDHAMIRESGCDKCLSCGHSKCSG